MLYSSIVIEGSASMDVNDGNIVLSVVLIIYQQPVVTIGHPGSYRGPQSDFFLVISALNNLAR